MANENQATQHWDALADEYDADLITYFGPVDTPHDRTLLSLVEQRVRRPNVILWLTTYGGDPHAAYRISRSLQNPYKTTKDGPLSQKCGTFTVFVDTNCKSAGTIIVLGANRLVMSDYAELGPIDLQLLKPDHGSERTSSLTPMQALNAMQTASFDLFKYYFRQLRANAAWNLTTKTAAELAANMTIGLMDPIYGQIDPIKLGEIDRFTKMSLLYGQKLANGNLKEDAVERLVAGYPSHGFVIDRREAKELFNYVDEPSGAFRALMVSRPVSESFLSADEPLIGFLNSPLPIKVAAPTAHPPETFEGPNGSEEEETLQ